MNNFKHTTGLIFLVFILSTECQPQNKGSKQNDGEDIILRQPAVAGQFYPSDPKELEDNLNYLFKEVKSEKILNVQAIIVPHAGYVFSGKVAASAYNLIDYKPEIKNVFILASSHRAYYEGASIYSLGNYLTPLGEVEINQEIVNNLRSSCKYFKFVPEAHEMEHSLEVQLPFLQKKMGSHLSIVPIVIGTQSKKVCKDIAEALKPYFTTENLFVISSDFSHYPSYEDAINIDGETLNSILSNSTDKFLQTINDKKNNNVPNLSTPTCGWTSILTLLYLTESRSDIEYKHILYENSGDSQYGDQKRVVGYHSICVIDKQINNEQSTFQLNNIDRKKLLSIARQAIESFLKNENIIDYDPAKLSDELNKECGAFVTLNKNHNLRGCIGRFTSDEPLFKVVQQMAIASATQDSRFNAVQQRELEDIEIEISVLTPLKKIESIDEIELGKHGIYIIKGYRSGTFLPQVATETGWNLEEFLGHCARDKAGIGWDGWKDAEVYIYEAIVFSEGQ